MKTIVSTEAAYQINPCAALWCSDYEEGCRYCFSANKKTGFGRIYCSGAQENTKIWKDSTSRRSKQRKWQLYSLFLCLGLRQDILNCVYKGIANCAENCVTQQKTVQTHCTCDKSWNTSAGYRFSLICLLPEASESWQDNCSILETPHNCFLTSKSDDANMHHNKTLKNIV